jgi:uncharacterized 2Fe-2S/4Fe-4S cluster protein (DUF4445 family)
MNESHDRCVIRFLPSERRVEIGAGEMTLLDATLAAGAADRERLWLGGGRARAAGSRSSRGAESLAPESERERRIKERNRIDPRHRLACRVRPEGDLTVRASYW